MTVPLFFLVVAALGLVAAIYHLWSSLRAAFGASIEQDLTADVEATSRRALLERKKALLSSLQDLRFERDAGKVSDADFQSLDGKLRAQAREVLRLLDADVEEFRQRAEALVRERLGKQKGSPYRKKAKANAPKDVRVECPKCNTTNDDDAQFCKSCATPLKPEPAAVETASEPEARDAPPGASEDSKAEVES